MKLAEVLDLFGAAPRPNGDEPVRPQPAPEPVKPAPGPRARTEAEALAVVKRSGGAWRRVVFTRNRRVMASVGNGGDELRLNERFAAAPARVLAAASEMFAASSQRRRDAARELVREFIQRGAGDGAGPPAEPAARAEPVEKAPGGRTEAQALAVARRGGGAWQRVVFTRNRRIMASVGSGGRDLRLNEAFATAPDRVLAAVSEMFAGRTARRRESAREVVRAFIHQLPPESAGAPARPRARAAAPGDAAQIARLQAEFDRVNAASFAGALPRVPLHLSGRMKRRNGHFSARPLEIVLSRRLCTHGAPGEAEQTLRHEMIHLWQFVEGIPVDHGAAFRRMARKLDVHPRATRRVEWADADGAK